MKIRILNVLCSGLVLIGFGLIAVYAQSSEEATKADPPTGEKDKVHPFLEQWKKIQTAVRKSGYETQQTRTSSGVRGDEAEKGLSSEFYLKEGGGYPSRLEINNAVLQLQQIISEHQFLMAQCYGQLGEDEKAGDIYKMLIKQYPETQSAKLAQEILDGMKAEKSEP